MTLRKILIEMIVDNSCVFIVLLVLLLLLSLLFFFIHNLKIYNLTKHVYKNDTIGSMIGMATLNDLLTKNQYRY